MAKKKKDYQAMARAQANAFPTKLEIKARRKALKDKKSFTYKATQAAKIGTTNKDLKDENILKTSGAGSTRHHYRQITGGIATTSRARGVDGRTVANAAVSVTKGSATFRTSCKGKEKRYLTATMPRSL